MDQTEIWRYFQNDAEIGNTAFNARPRYEFIARRIAPGLHVLNIGVGRGGLEAILAKKGVVVNALDPDAQAINRIAQEYGLKDRAKVGFSQAIPFADGQFDVVTMLEVLEHLTDEVLNATLGEVKRVLKAGGCFIGTTPADENLMANRVVCPHCGQLFHRWGHLQSFSDERLGTLLSEHFELGEVSRHFFAEVRTLNWKGRVSWGIKKTLVGLGVKGDGESFFFLARKR